MKIWTSNHTFSHPWETVVQAASRKYPNPINQNVLGVDVLDRSVDPQSGVLKSHRLLSTTWGVPDWIIQLIGMQDTCYVSEHSEVNPKQKAMTLFSRNVSMSSIVSIAEQMTYVPDPEDPKNRTLLKQEATITVNGIPMSSYCEHMIKSTISSKAQMGRQAMEWVISHIKEESQGVRKVFSATSTSL